MTFDTILFDLEGTLTDSGPGIMNCVRYALTEMGREIPDDLTCFIGPPLESSFMDFCGLTKDEAQQAIDLYRKRYVEKGMMENSVYDGIPELLSRLRDKGLRLAVATSKYELYAEKVTDSFGLTGYFDGIYGSEKNAGRTEKPDVIKYALGELGDPDMSRVLMIGDRMYDVEGAHEVGTAGMGVLWGYGSREELEGAGADFIALTPQEAADMICMMNN